MDAQLTILPIDYYPCESTDGFQDNIDDITSLQFKDIGVRCSCNKKVYYNKYTFNAQHVKSQKHQDYLKALVDNKPNLVKTLIEQQKTIKTLKIQLGSSEQRITQSLQKLKAVSEKNDALNSELTELKIQLADRDEYIKNMEENLCAETDILTAEAKQYQEKTSKTEAILKQLMALYDYEID